ncbi:MAG: DNA gyrase subunit A [Acholeplasmatales bacterium]|nr:DNA gyrase subunit A [Acholeplasmatales bacterium]
MENNNTNNLNDENLTEEEIIKEEHDKVEPVMITQKVKSSFLDYAMSVIVARALPDARDGLKPVQRRILYGMNQLGVYSNTAHKKSARIVGEVMGKYHPHGDSSIYDAMVRMAQPFNYRYMLVDGHGNFGSVDGDGAAAMRYTEARMSKISMEMLRDINKNTVDFIDNYDATEIEPTILPARFPNLLVNGSMGIAVGMATNIPPHNLGEVIDGVIALMDNPDIDTDGLMQYIKGPDFPTGGLVLGAAGLKNAYDSGLGTIVIRSKVDIEEAEQAQKHHIIIVREIPYTVNKARLIERIGEVTKLKLVDGIVDLRDESNDRNGTKIVIEVRHDVNPQVLLNKLYKLTQLQISFGINMICLVDGKPCCITLKKALEVYLKHQFDVITRRIKFDLDKAEQRLHILEGLKIALDNIDEIIKVIRGTTDGTEKEQLMTRFGLDDIQAQAILDMQLRRLSGLNREKTYQEYDELIKTVEDLKATLESPERRMQIIRDELIEIKEKYGDKRRSELSLSTALNIEDEDLIPVEDVVITVTKSGYIKRMKQDVYRAQNRGGVGVTGIKTNANDVVDHILPMSSHDHLIVFTNLGRIYDIKGYQVPEGTRQAKGLPVVNLLKLGEGEKLQTITTVKDLEDKEKNFFFATKNGVVKRTSFAEFQNIRSNGIIAIELKDGDELLSVIVTEGHDEILLGASNGKAIRFNEDQIRKIGRSAAGVRGMTLPEGVELIGLTKIYQDDDQILVVTSNGYGKRTNATEYRSQLRGGMGVKTFNATEKNGDLVSLTAIADSLDLIITTNKGVVIRMAASDISLTSRATQGVRVINLRPGQKVSTIAVVPHDENEEMGEFEEAPAE